MKNTKFIGGITLFLGTLFLLLGAAGNGLAAKGINAAAFSNVTTTQLQANWMVKGPKSNSYTAILSVATSPGTNQLSGNKTITTPTLSALFTGLSPNTRYYVDVIETDKLNKSAFTSLGSIATLANPPLAGNPSNISTNQITANWNANGNPANTTYLVQASNSADFAAITVSLSVTATSAILTGLAPNTQYFMRVQATNQSSVSTAFTALPPAVTSGGGGPSSGPGAAGFTGITSAALQANWTANGNPAGTTYTVILSKSPSPSTNGASDNQTQSTTSTFAVFSALAPNTIYYADVKAVNTSYTSLGSVPTLANAPNAGTPSNISEDGFTANWAANGNPAGTLYVVQLALSADFANILEADLTNDRFFTFTGLSPNTQYFSRVRANNQSGLSTPFTTLPPAVTSTAAPEGATLKAALVSDSAITWTWSSVPNAVGYRLLSETGVNVSGDFPSSTLQWQESGLSVNTAYTRKLVAFNSASETSSPLTTAYTLAHGPVNLALQSVASTAITLSWKANGNPVSTQYVAQATSGAGVVTQSKVTGLQATLDNLTGDTTYFCTVWALNGAGAAAEYNGNVIAVTPAQQIAQLQIDPEDTSNLAFNTPRGMVSVDISPNTFDQPVTMTLRMPSVFPQAPSAGSAVQGIGIGIEITLDKPLEPQRDLTISLPYRETDVAGLDQNSLVVARYDPPHQAWVPLPTTVENHTATATTQHLSLYQIMTSVAGSSLSDVRVHPNPFRPTLGHQTIKFTSLPLDASVKIYSLTGEKICELKPAATGTATWDGRNSSGQATASGVYFAVIESQGDKKILKVAIQR